MHFLAALTVFCAFALYGVICSSKIGDKIAFLEDLTADIDKLKALIGYFKLPLPTLLARENVYKREELWGDAAACLNSGLTLSETAETLERRGKFKQLEPNERQMLTDFFNSLGSSDSTGGAYVCEATSMELKRYLDEIRKKSRDKMKLYRSLGFLGGICFAVLLL